MNHDKKAARKTRNTTKKSPVQVITNREFVGTRTLIEAFIPVICEDIRKAADDADTLGIEELTA